MRSLSRSLPSGWSFRAPLRNIRKRTGLPVLDASREKEKLDRVAEQSPAELREYTRRLYTLLIELSRDYQRELIGKERG